MDNLTDVILKLINKTENYEACYPYQNTELLWDILTALRGPDEDTDELRPQLKRLTIARIRGILNLDYVSVGVRGAALSQEEIERRDKLLRKTSTHFQRHFKIAMDALFSLGYPAPKEECCYRVDHTIDCTT